VNVDAIPLELRERRQWVVYRAIERDGKTTKVPYRADGAGRASSTDPSTWATFDASVAGAEALAADGIGYVFSPDDPYLGADLDDGLTEADRAAIIVALDSYTETSPSGDGVHVIMRASLNGHGRNRKGPFEVYDQGRYFTVTGQHVVGTPTTVEERQAQLDEVLAHFLPKPEPRLTNASVSRSVDLDDRDLLNKAMSARNGSDFRELWEGRWEHRYSSQSEGDLALCSSLAFWTGNDPVRIDHMFRSTGLMRDKWDSRRGDSTYGSETIAKALEGDVHTPSRQVRPASDALGTHPASDPEDGVKGAGASRVPYVVGTQGRDAPSSPSDVSVSEVRLEVEDADAFAAVDEASAEPLLGDDDNTILAAGGSAVYYGDGGAGKTTLGLDRACHLAAGDDWLGLPVPNPVRVLWIENEGPRGKFRQKVRAKLAAWDGSPLEKRLHVLSAPWARFTFANTQMRVELVALLASREIDVVIAGPVSRLGAEGGGTPQEIQAFVDLLELVRADLGRPLAYELIHHENKQGAVSGAWEGATDTLAHVQARGNGHTAVVWRKTRWAPQLHGRTWKLNWQPGERFVLDDEPETTDEDIAEKLLGLVREAPGQSWNSYDGLLQGQATRKRVIRDGLLESGALVNAGTEKAMKLYLSEQADVQEALVA